MGITVALTGPTGDVGPAVVAALERDERVESIVTMGRQPLVPREHGWRRTRYLRGDILDRESVQALVEGADVVVHLAFAILGNREQTHRVNLTGARNLFSAAAQADRPTRLVYTSSAAAYGFGRNDHGALTEAEPVRTDIPHYYSADKAAVERVLAEATAGSGLESYVLRPCAVAGPNATALADVMPWHRVGHKGSQRWRRAVQRLRDLRPPFPDPGFEMQLVHHDDLATAITAAALGQGPAGAYNIAADGVVAFADLIRAAGGRPVRVPRAVTLAVVNAVERIPGTPAALDWVQVGRSWLLVDATKAREQLGWQPAHTAQQTLAGLAAAVAQLGA